MTLAKWDRNFFVILLCGLTEENQDTSCVDIGLDRNPARNTGLPRSRPLFWPRPGHGSHGWLTKKPGASPEAWVDLYAVPDRSRPKSFNPGKCLG